MTVAVALSEIMYNTHPFCEVVQVLTNMNGEYFGSADDTDWRTLVGVGKRGSVFQSLAGEQPASVGATIQLSASTTKIERCAMLYNNPYGG